MFSNIMHMDPLFLVGTAFGSLLTWAIIKEHSDKQRHAEFQRELQAEAANLEGSPKPAAERSPEEVRLEGDAAETNLAVLMCLDLAKIADAKQILILELGRFYHQWNPAREGDRLSWPIGERLWAIEAAARSFDSVKAALRDPPDNGGPTA